MEPATAMVPTDRDAAALAAFEALVRAEQARLLRIAWRFTRDGEEARDLVQSALADAFERRRHLRDAAAGPGWLRRVLVNRAINLHRRRKLWGSLQRWLTSPIEATHEARVEAQLDDARRLRALHAQIAELPARQAAAFTLRYLEGLSLEETAEALGIAAGTVRIHLYRALRSLKAETLLDGDAP